MGFMKEEGLAKAVAITIGGMGGFLLGIRRGGVIRQVFYSGVGMSAMASFCYPNETVDLLRASVQYGKRQWVQFKQRTYFFILQLSLTFALLIPNRDYSVPFSTISLILHRSR